MQMNNKLQKWKYKASVLNNTANLVFLGMYPSYDKTTTWCVLVMAKSQFDMP